LGILNNTFKSAWYFNDKSNTLKVVLARPILLHGSEIWILRQKDKKKRLTLTEMKFSRRTARYTRFDNRKNEELSKT
jgi:hypothetical protein